MRVQLTTTVLLKFVVKIGVVLGRTRTGVGHRFTLSLGPGRTESETGLERPGVSGTILSPSTSILFTSP